MAVNQVKRSIHKKQLVRRGGQSDQPKTNKQPTQNRRPSIKAARRNNRRASDRHPDRRKPAERRTQSRSTASGSFALVERKLPCRRFVEFPQVNGRTIKQIHFYTATDYHSITIDFQDQTSLNLEIEPGFTINAELQQIKKGETHTLAEWPRIHGQ